MTNELSSSDLRTRLLATAEALQRAEERATAGQLALELMHEVRDPLEALGHLTYLAYHEAERPDAVREYMRMAEEQMTHLTHIATQTLSFTRSSNTTKPMDLVALSEAAIRIHQRKIDTKKIHLVRDLPERLVAEVWRSELLQALSNLIDNAINALPEEGTISLRLRKREGKIHFLVVDNGHGIPKEHLDAIFEPFFTTKGEQGTGLGLALCKRVIDRHHGKINVRSSIRAGRNGTMFRVSLPV